MPYRRETRRQRLRPRATTSKWRTTQPHNCLMVCGVRPEPTSRWRGKKEIKMKMNPLRNKLVLLVGLGALALFTVVAYAASSTILGVGTNAHSEIINGP